LHLACYYNLKEICEVLLKHPFTNNANGFGYTPLDLTSDPSIKTLLKTKFKVKIAHPTNQNKISKTLNYWESKILNDSAIDLNLNVS
jgi:hypothetical protein